MGKVIVPKLSEFIIENGGYLRQEPKKVITVCIKQSNMPNFHSLNFQLPICAVSKLITFGTTSQV